MSGIGGIIHWDDAPVETRLLDGMMGMIRHRGPDGMSSEVRGQVGFGHALLMLKKREKSYKQPVWTSDGSGIVADARLFNRDELIGWLSDVRWLGDDPSDAALILAAYERWGADALQKLDGDFAFVTWDARTKQIFAARDPLGAKPLFYRAESERFLFGSEPKQLLVMPGVPVTPNDLVVGEFLSENYEETPQTFFEGVLRLVPGHFICGRQKQLRQTRYWLPDLQKQIIYPETRDYFDHFRELLRKSVHHRLQTDFPVGSHLSGGLDSSSIVVMAADIYRSGESGLPVFETISAAFPGMYCDETEQIQSVVKATPFRSHLFVPLSESLVDGLADDLWQADRPFADAQRPVFTLCARTLTQMGARTLLMGVGGDELLTEHFFLRDLVAKKQYGRVLREMWEIRGASYWSFGRMLFDTTKEMLPEWPKRLYRQVSPIGKWHPPATWNPEFVKQFYSFPSGPSRHPENNASLTQAANFMDVTHPLMPWLLEFYDTLGSYYGYEVGCPFLDRPLIEFVLAIPIEQRTAGEKWKTLVRRGLAADLPQEVLARRRKVDLDPATIHFFSAYKSALQACVLDSPQWLSGEYIVKETFQKEFSNDLPTGSFPAKLIYELWRPVCLELWLRGLVRYEQQKLA